jgi:hypothetical protein
MPRSAAAAEALAESIPVTFQGETYQIPPTSEWGYDILEAFEEGRLVAFFKALLGPEQHEKFRAKRPKLAAVNEFAGEVQKALGISGN